MTTDLTYDEIGLAASAPYWRGLAAAVPHAVKVGRNTAGDWLEIDSIRGGETTGILLLGIEATSAHDHRAIVWALAEIQRRKEEAGRHDAAMAEARAMHELAEAIAKSGEEDVLARLLPKLTERTQSAVRSQLST